VNHSTPTDSISLDVLNTLFNFTLLNMHEIEEYFNIKDKIYHTFTRYMFYTMSISSFYEAHCFIEFN